ncbi:MAG: 30S ribosomal protein S20 [Planctomycetaceae bacterium]|nr:30S ribosomal protein S20 [Planctomycetaceae bacterium]
MPNTESAKRALRKMRRRNERNRAQRSALRTTIKKVRKAAGASDAPASQEALAIAIKKIDQSAAKGLIHKNKAARDKSRLTRLVNKVSSAPSPAAQG